jgi:thermitase
MRRHPVFLSPLIIAITVWLSLGLPRVGINAQPGALSPSPAPAVVRLPGNRFAAGRILVRYRPGTPAVPARRVESTIGAVRIAAIQGLGVQVLEVPNGAIGAALKQLRRSRSVEFAERDGIAAATDTIPNDPMWSSEWAEVTARAPAAWDVTTGSSAVEVAVLDTGVDFN